MEHAPFQSRGKAVLRPKPKGQDQRAHRLHGKAAHQHPFLQTDDAVHIADTQRLRHQHPLLQTHLSSE